MDDTAFLLEEITLIKYRLNQLENEKKNNYCETCKTIHERILSKCDNCERRVCKYCCCIKDRDDNKIYCPRKCCLK